MKLWMVIAGTGILTAACVTGLWMQFGKAVPEGTSSVEQQPTQPIGQ